MKVQGTTTAPKSWQGAQRTYVEPGAGEALHIGHGGQSVMDLQRQLNAAGAKPPLEVDGKFGPKTQAALQSLTGSQTATPAALQQLEGKSASSFSPPAQATPAQQAPAQTQVGAATPIPVSTGAPSDVAARAVSIAQSENGSIDPMRRGEDGNYVGWQHLKEVFTKATGVEVSDAEVKKHNQPLGKSWCGIWACHVLQEAGVNVKWDLTKGKMVGDVTQTMAPRFSSPAQYKAERQAFEQSIRPGDVITLDGKNNHHAVVTKVNPDGTVETMDGNKPHVGPGHYKLSNVTSFYRAN